MQHRKICKCFSIQRLQNNIGILVKCLNSCYDLVWYWMMAIGIHIMVFMCIRVIRELGKAPECHDTNTLFSCEWPFDKGTWDVTMQRMLNISTDILQMYGSNVENINCLLKEFGIGDSVFAHPEFQTMLGSHFQSRISNGFRSINKTFFH